MDQHLTKCIKLLKTRHYGPSHKSNIPRACIVCRASTAHLIHVSVLYQPTVAICPTCLKKK